MRDRSDGRTVAQPVPNGDGFWIARQWDHVVLAENTPLLEDRSPDLAQYDAVTIRPIVLVAPRVLHRLKIDTANAAPLLGVPQNIANLLVIDALAHCSDEGCGQTTLFEIGERHLVSAAQISAA